MSANHELEILQARKDVWKELVKRLSDVAESLKRISVLGISMNVELSQLRLTEDDVSKYGEIFRNMIVACKKQAALSIADYYKAKREAAKSPVKP